MVILPILLALYLARVIWATFFCPEAKDQAQLISETLIARAEQMNTLLGDVPETKKEKMWSAFNATNPTSIEALADTAPSFLTDQDS